MLVFEDHGALDRVLQLADVARPVVAEQQLAGSSVMPVTDFLKRRLYAVDEEVHQRQMSSLRSRSGGIKMAMIARR